MLFWLTAIDLGLSGVLLQRVATAYGRTDIQDTGRYIASGLSVSVVLACIILIGGTLMASCLSSVLRLSDTYSMERLETAFLVAVCGTSISFLGISVGGVNKAIQGSFGAGVTTVASQICGLASIFISLVVGMGVVSLAIGGLVGGLVLLTGNVVYFLSRRREEAIPLELKIDHFKDIASMLSFGSLGSVGFLLSERIDAFVVARSLGPELTPLLVLTKRGPGVADMFLNRPGNAFAPTVAHLAGEADSEKARRVLSRLLRLLIWGAGLAATGFALLNQSFVTLWVGEEMFAGNRVNIVIALSLLIGAPLRNMAVLSSAMGDIKGIAIMGFVRGIATCLFLFLGVSYLNLGVLGVVLAPLLSMFTVALVYVPISFSKRLDFTVSDWRAFLKELILVVVSGFIPYVCLPKLVSDSWLEFTFQCVLVMIAFLSLLFLMSRTFRAEAILLAQKIPGINKA
jgi:O-antigen/teichoic acid export membrane protein